ncbi:MAG: helix-turn-helix domain-containing protein [Clostridia bacterium]|nr:helix-turn-helix domain-containing protein [Clostridia bacterium]
MKKEVYYDLSQDGEVDIVCQALASNSRRKILGLLRKGSYTINEIGVILNIPLSTLSTHMAVLKQAKLINVSKTNGMRGSSKMISRRCDMVKIEFDDIDTPVEEKIKTMSLEIPIGSYTDVKASNICGIASDKEFIGVDDMPSAFFHPARMTAGILWFSHGYVEYRIPNYYLYGHRALVLNISLELCSEAPNFNMEWPSDITFWINGTEICTYTSSGDYGDRRGTLTPKWWSEFSTQYGLMKNIRVDGYGVFIDAEKAGSTEIDTLKLEENEYFTLKIGIKDDARHKGGLNLFGKTFGDHPQDISVRVDYV